MGTTWQGSRFTHHCPCFFPTFVSHRRTSIHTALELRQRPLPKQQTYLMYTSKYWVAGEARHTSHISRHHQQMWQLFQRSLPIKVLNNSFNLTNSHKTTLTTCDDVCTLYNLDKCTITNTYVQSDNIIVMWLTCVSQLLFNQIVAWGEIQASRIPMMLVFLWPIKKKSPKQLVQNF